MDVTEDTRLQELKAALATYPQEEAQIESQDVTSWIDDLSGIAALTTLDLSQLTTSSIQAFSNTSIQLGGNASAVTWTGGGGGGGSGVVYGTGTPYTVTSGTGIWTNTNTGKMQISADDIEIKGKSMMATLDRIEKRLGLLECNEILEEEWAELKALGEQYRQLQKHIEDKVKTFETLKK